MRSVLESGKTVEFGALDVRRQDIGITGADNEEYRSIGVTREAIMHIVNPTRNGCRFPAR